MLELKTQLKCNLLLSWLYEFSKRKQSSMRFAQMSTGDRFLLPLPLYLNSPASTDAIWSDMLYLLPLFSSLALCVMTTAIALCFYFHRHIPRQVLRNCSSSSSSGLAKWSVLRENLHLRLPHAAAMARHHSIIKFRVSPFLALHIVARIFASLSEKEDEKSTI